MPTKHMLFLHSAMNEIAFMDIKWFGLEEERGLHQFPNQMDKLKNSCAKSHAHSSDRQVLSILYTTQ